MFANLLKLLGQQGTDMTGMPMQQAPAMMLAKDYFEANSKQLPKEVIPFIYPEKKEDEEE